MNEDNKAIEQQEPEQPYSAESSMISDAIKKALAVQGKKHGVSERDVQVCIYPDDKWQPHFKTLTNWDIQEPDISYTDVMGVKVDFRGVSLLLKIKMPVIFRRVCENFNVPRENLRLIFTYDGSDETNEEPICFLYSETELKQKIDINEIYY